MKTIKIKVIDYYNNPSYYSVMPQEIFDALEAGSLAGNETVQVDKRQFDMMLEDYKNKMEK